MIGENSVIGTMFKVNLNMTPIDGHTLASVDWEAKVFTESTYKSVTIRKSEARKIDDDNYIILIDSSILGAGKYYITLTAYLPDGDYANGVRIEKRTAFTGVTIDVK